MRQAIILTTLTFLFLGGCAPATPAVTEAKPIRKNLRLEEKTQKPFRIVFYDFDQTLPVIHVFHETKGADDVSGKNDQFFIDAFGALPSRV